MRPYTPFGQGQWGARSIHEDIHRTYANPSLPHRSDPSFQRAMEYRSREVQSTNNLRKEHHDMTMRFNAMTSALEEAQREVAVLEKYKKAYLRKYQNSSRVSTSHGDSATELRSNSRPQRANRSDGGRPSVRSSEYAQNGDGSSQSNTRTRDASSSGDAPILDGPPVAERAERRSTGEDDPAAGGLTDSIEHS